MDLPGGRPAIPSSVHGFKSIEETGQKIGQKAGPKPARLLRHGVAGNRLRAGCNPA